jgi:hypothetical protein
MRVSSTKTTVTLSEDISIYNRFRGIKTGE